MNIKVEKAKREDGFTLIELLVVVIIIGILAAIAIPVFLNQRERARDAAVQSTLRSSATYQEIEFTEEGDYTGTVGNLEAEGFRQGDGIAFTIEFNGATGYCHQASHDQSDTIWAISSVVGEAGAPVEGECDGTGNIS